MKVSIEEVSVNRALLKKVMLDISVEELVLLIEKLLPLIPKLPA